MPQSTDLSTPFVRPSRDGAVECEFVNFIPDIPDEYEPYESEGVSGLWTVLVLSLAFWTGAAVAIGSKMAGWW